MTVGSHNGSSYYPWGPPDICPHALVLPLVDERSWPVPWRIGFYFVGLLWFFLGVSIVTDIFMASIETITSKTKKIYMAKTKARKVIDQLLFQLKLNMMFFNSCLSVKV